MRYLIEILLFLWQLPQNIVALVMYPFLGKKTKLEKGIYVAEKMQGGISLGQIIYLSKYSATKDTIAHEQGHQKQSLYLGWLYLFIIGIPSIIWAGLYGKVIPRTPNGYYRFYTERWADKLGGVKRS